MKVLTKDLDGEFFNPTSLREMKRNLNSQGIVNPGGSDLIGWTRVKITQKMLGNTVAVFTALEVKTPDWKGPKNNRELRQQHFIQTVAKNGGIAGFVRSPHEAKLLVT
ncbi:hypothetical protein IH799_05225, partial [candidate division KSB1 bacterium]|nr:hypothetical protein [candidate division KSB1 bacterium]